LRVEEFVGAFEGAAVHRASQYLRKEPIVIRHFSDMIPTFIGHLSAIY
jgi:hypothetical protein